MPDSPTTEELIAGLLRRARDARNVTGGWGFDEAILFEAAASRLDALTAENARLTSAAKDYARDLSEQVADNKSLTARLARLEGTAMAVDTEVSYVLDKVEIHPNLRRDLTAVWERLRAVLSPEQKEGT